MGLGLYLELLLSSFHLGSTTLQYAVAIFILQTRQLRLRNFLKVMWLVNHKVVIQTVVSASQAHTPDCMLLREALLFDLSSQFFELCFIITNYIDEETEALSVK